MDIKQLEYFAAVVEEGNISSAAKKLHISQPPLSTQIQKLEEDVGCVLFERGSRKIQITEAGNMLYRRAKTLIEMAELTKKELRDYNSGKHGIMRLGVVSSVEIWFSICGLNRFVKSTTEYSLKFQRLTHIRLSTCLRQD